MADADSSFPSNDGLAAALRSLPLQQADGDCWPALAAALQARTAKAPAPRRRWRWAAASALAASLVIAAVLPWSTQSPTPVLVDELTPTPASGVEPIRDADLAWLRQRSTQLEGWLAELPTPPVRDGRSVMATVEVEDLIGLVDLQLDASRNPGEALPLWRQRVALLEELSVLRSAAFGVAVTDAAPAVSQPAPLL